MIIQITSGRGPAECGWVVAQLLKFMLVKASDLAIETQVLQKTMGQEQGSLLSADLLVKGTPTNEFAKYFVGTVQWIGESPFRKGHKRKNWFVGVAVFDTPEQIGFRESEITYRTFRASGPGGQHVNKTDSAVEAKHAPSGITAMAQDSPSQHKNKKLATERLLFALQKGEKERNEKRKSQKWQKHNDLQRGNPVLVFIGAKFKLMGKL